MSNKNRHETKFPPNHLRLVKRNKAPRVAGLPMVVDGEPIRRAARRANDEIRARMEAMERQIDVFERQDSVAYQRWVHLSFGPLLSELRDIATAVEAKQAILDRVEEYRIWDNLSAARAYAKVKSELANPDFDPDQDLEDPDSVDFDLNEENEQDVRNVYEAAKSAYEQKTGFKPPDFESFKKMMGFGDANDQNREDSNGSESSRIKKLYRRIARSLHPDCSENFSTREQQLWHRAQAAYRAGDLIGLETVFSHIEAAASGPLFASSVSELMERTREMRERIGYLEEDLFQARQHPGWRFTQKTATQVEALRQRAKRELEQSLKMAKDNLADLEAEIQELESALFRMNTRKRKKKRQNPIATPSRKRFNFST